MTPIQSKLDDIRKICVLRSGEIGDLLVTLPALKAIHVIYPEAEIVLLGKPWQKAFFVKGRSPVDRVIVVPVTRHIRDEAALTEDEAEIDAFIDTMRYEQFDLAINFQGDGLYSNPFLERIKARYYLGPVSCEQDYLGIGEKYCYYQNESVRFLEYILKLGNAPISLEPELNILEEDFLEVEDLVKLLYGERYIVINPFARDLRRMWPLENYPVLAELLKDKGYEIVFSGSAEQKEEVQRIIEQLPFPVYNSCGISLGGLAALMSQAAVMLGPDTGPLHLARAVRTPTVGIYWAPNLINWGPLTRDRHYPLISWNLHCPVCGIIPNKPYPFKPLLTDCDHMVSFVRDVRIDEVVAAIERITTGSAAVLSSAVPGKQTSYTS